MRNKGSRTLKKTTGNSSPFLLSTFLSFLRPLSSLISFSPEIKPTLFFFFFFFFFFWSPQNPRSTWPVWRRYCPSSSQHSRSRAEESQSEQQREEAAKACAARAERGLLQPALLLFLFFLKKKQAYSEFMSFSRARGLARVCVIASQR